MRPWADCACEWKEKIKSAYNLALEGIRKITFNGKDYTVSDGNGGVTIDTPTAEDIDLTDGRTVQAAVDAIEDEIGDDDTAGSLRQYADRALYYMDSPNISADDEYTDVAWLNIVRNNGVLSTIPFLHGGTGISLKKQTDSANRKFIGINNTGVLAALAGDGISVNSQTGNVKITNTGVTSINGETGNVIQNIPTIFINQSKNFEQTIEDTFTTVTSGNATNFYENDSVGLNISQNGNFYIFYKASADSFDNTIDANSNMFIGTKKLADYSFKDEYNDLPNGAYINGMIRLDNAYFAKTQSDGSYLFTNVSDQPISLTKDTEGNLIIEFNSEDDNVPLAFYGGTTAPTIAYFGFTFCAAVTGNLN